MQTPDLTRVPSVNRLMQLLAAVLLAVAVAPASAADAGIYTIVDGDARVLRGTKWFRLADGARMQDGDVIDVGERAQLQLEWTDGATLNLHGPGLAHAGALVAGDRKASPVAEMHVLRGWLKASAKPSRPLRLRLPAMTAQIGDAVIVVHGDAGLGELFVESGTAKVSIAARGKDGPPRDVKVDEYVVRTGDRALVAANRPPAAFLAAMPREFRDALPSLAHQFQQPPPALAEGRDITLAEAEPWLSGPGRRIFVKRFTPRLADAEFRAGVAARPAAYPEWDRMLNPEKYRPRQAGEAK
jgi:hypothetical protein